jgi:biopolymer transport protein ExbD
MKFNSRYFLIFVVLIVFVVLAFFAVTSKKPLVNNSGSKVSTPSSEVGEEINLEITSPKDGEVVTKSPVLVSGTTVGGADVSVNDAETKADVNGEFKVSIPLEEGENEIFVTANDQDGNYAESSVKITLNTE